MLEKNYFSSDDGDLDVIVEAGEILMESGAEIYRIDETMRHMAKAFQIEHFETYVANREILVSGTNQMGIREAKVITVPEVNIHLGKLEAVNALSREIVSSGHMTLREITERLKDIREFPESSLGATLLAYFIGAGSFSYAIGSSMQDSFASAVIGMIMGLVLRGTGKIIRTSVLLTIIGSAVVTIMANLLFEGGFAQNRALIILGTLMVLVPGATFTNSVREFSQNNHVTGLTLLMSSLLTCLSLAVGVVLATDLFPFVEPMTSAFSGTVQSCQELLGRTIMAGTGTAAFSFLFHAPSRYFRDIGIMGAFSWMMYLLLNTYFSVDMIGVFLPALFVALLSRYLAVKRKCPATIFVSTSIFPLIPGLSFYRAVYFLMIGAPTLAWTFLRGCFISAFAIALAIIIMQELRIKTVV